MVSDEHEIHDIKKPINKGFLKAPASCQGLILIMIYKFVRQTIRKYNLNNTTILHGNMV